MNQSRHKSTAGRWSWALYDWANSAFFAVIQTFVFATYFMQSVAKNDTIGSTQWGNTIGFAGLAVALSAPFLGAMADQLGRRKPWIAGFSLLCVLATAGLWFVKPSHDYVLLGLVLVFIGTVGSECAIIFYNAMLPDIASGKRLGRWSGWAWGLGYAGGLACLVIALVVFVNVDHPPFGLQKATAQHVRATFLLVAGWYALFSIPLLTITRDRPRTNISISQAVGQGIEKLKDSLKNIKKYRPILRFLIARMIFIDALATVFAFGGIYASGTFDMSATKVLMFGIGLNLTAGLGAAGFAWLDDRLGSRNTMLIALAGLIVMTSAVLLVTSLIWFWIFGLLIGVFVGPAQAASRTYMAHVAPEDVQNQMFGLMAFSGKATAFAGPFLVGWLTYATDSQRLGMSIIVAMFLLGFGILYSIPNAENASFYE